MSNFSENDRQRQLEREANERRLQEAKERLLIPELWELLHLPGKPPARGAGVCKSPFREERNPSFSIFADGRGFKDFATNESGDAVEFLRIATGLEGRPLLDRFREMAGVQPREDETKTFIPRVRDMRSSPAKEPEPEKIADRKTMAIPSIEDLRAIAGTRGLSLSGLGLAVKRGYLRTGTVRGTRCWIVCESNGRIAAARRLDGEQFTRPDGSTYKSHALTGKRLPLGLSALPAQPSLDSAILLTEGEGDFLAAHHFIAQWGEPNLYAVAMLGRTTGLHPEAAQRLAGWRIMSLPHNDADAGGWGAMGRWALNIPEADVTAFCFDGLRQTDGSPVKDLNDAVRACEEDAAVLGEMNPLPQRPHLDPDRLEFDRANDLRASLWGRITGSTPEGFPITDGAVCPF